MPEGTYRMKPFRVVVVDVEVAVYEVLGPPDRLAQTFLVLRFPLCGDLRKDAQVPGDVALLMVLEDPEAVPLVH